MSYTASHLHVVKKGHFDPLDSNIVALQVLAVGTKDHFELVEAGTN